MTAEKLICQLSCVEERYIDEAAPDWGMARVSGRRMLAIVLAAALALLLVSCGVVAAIYGDNIQNWFSYYWEAVTGHEMGEGQTAVIDHLTQEIGISQTVDGITVTVDSATVGDDNFFLLLRVEGAEFSRRHSYGFDEVHMAVEPDPMAGGGLAGYGFQFHGIDGDGAALFLMDWAYTAETGYRADIQPLEVTLNLTDFGQNMNTKPRKVIGEGEWHFAFTIDRSQPPQVLEIPDTEVIMTNLKTLEDVPVMMTDIQLTNTGLRLCYDYTGGMFALSAEIDVILKSGISVHISGGGGSPLADGNTLSCSYQWMVPIDLEEVAGLQIGYTYIPVDTDSQLKPLIRKN
ncbi:MAG: DUF4179 domain-containing protein [Oscillospiraceae bacterium]|nr:DUF4179 domain-containing protein [Oscillospiraceae bacterium]